LISVITNTKDKTILPHLSNWTARIVFLLTQPLTAFEDYQKF